MDACDISPSMISRRPWRFRAARVGPRATTLTVAPARERRAAIIPPIAPAPIMQNFGGAGTVTGVRLAHESAKENSILDRELMDMRAAKGRGSVGPSAFSGACKAVTFRSFSSPCEKTRA